MNYTTNGIEGRVLFLFYIKMAVESTFPGNILKA
jgi:hypothetical protein